MEKNFYPMAKRLEWLRECAKAERRAHGRVLTETAQAMAVAMAETEAALAIEDARDRAEAMHRRDLAAQQRLGAARAYVRSNLPPASV